MIGHFSDDDSVVEFVNSHDLERLAALGTSCPDHFLRTKIRPLVLDLPSNADLSDSEELKKRLQPQWVEYRTRYDDYYASHKRNGSPPIRDNNPVIILWPGIGLFAFARNKQTARVASEFYINAINVMRGAESVSTYVALPLQEAFDIEYWLLEEAKLKRMPKEKPLSRKVALITGSGGGIGLEIARQFVDHGACVMLTDVNENRLKEAHSTFAKDVADWTVMDVTSSDSVEKAFQKASLRFGGVDIIVNNAGIAISASIEDTSEEDWELQHNIMVKGSFLTAKCGITILKKQGLGGDVVNIVSKNSIAAGKDNLGYGSAKAAQAHMTRLMAADFAVYGVRVNSVNPDAVIRGSNIWEDGWAENRAKGLRYHGRRSS